MARTRKPTIAEEREALAANGDVAGILKLIVNTEPCFFTREDVNHEDVFRLLLKSIEVASRKDPARFADFLFSKMLSLTAYMVLRSNFLAVRAFAGHDRNVRGRASMFPPHDIEKELLPGLLALQNHAAVIAEGQARVARLWRLAKHRADDEVPPPKATRQTTRSQRVKPRQRSRGRVRTGNTK